MSLESGYLKKYFRAIIAKKLSAVEITPKKSNQHEFNATVKMREIFGSDRCDMKTVFLYIDEETTVTATGKLTWYDAREAHPKRTEYRLYYPTTPVFENASEGDSLFICVKPDNSALCIISRQGTTITNQLYWLFDIDEKKAERFVQNNTLDTNGNNLEFAARTVLSQIGIEYEETDDEGLLEGILKKFGGNFPKTSLFSAYARSLVRDVDPVGAPDETLIQWFSMEEKLFFLLEQHIVRERLQQGFLVADDVDVDGFMEFSLSVQNRRKSRAGLSLENHISALLNENHISYSHTPVTENRSKPDFLFPDIMNYHDENFPADYLTMLGSKSTCKDRWRQILAEANRIERKHLLTLEAAISEYQTDEMQDKKLQLVVPESIQKTYNEKQQQWLYTVSDFLDEVREKQRLLEYRIQYRNNG